MRRPHGLLLLALVLATRTVSAQAPPREHASWTGGGGLLIGLPQDAFADATETAFGATGHAFFAPKGGPLGIRGEMGVLIYGSRTTHVPVVGSGGLITEDLTTDNWLLNAGVGPQLMVRSGPVRPYAYGLAGLGYFATDTTLGQPGYTGISSTNYDDTTFAWSAGGGLLIAVSRSVAIDLGVRYVANGTVRYLAEGDLRPSPTGVPPVIVPRRTEANLVTVTIGVHVGH